MPSIYLERPGYAALSAAWLEQPAAYAEFSRRFVRIPPERARR